MSWRGDGRYRALRREVLERDGHACRVCGSEVGLELDHVVRVADGGDRWDPANCQALCVRCHRLKTRREASNHEPDPEWARLVAEAESW